MTSNEAVDLDECVTASSAVEIIKGTTKEAVFVCKEEFLVPEFIGIKNVLCSG